MAGDFCQQFFKSTSSAFIHVDKITFHGVQKDILHKTNDQNLFFNARSINIYTSLHINLIKN